MYGCIEPFIVYGFSEKDNSKKINDTWLEKNGLEYYTTNSIRLYAYTMVYGLDCKFDDTGKILLDNKSRDRITRAYNKLSSEDYSKLGYFLVISCCDLADAHHVYSPRKNEKEEEEGEEEGEEEEEEGEEEEEEEEGEEKEGEEKEGGEEEGEEKEEEGEEEEEEEEEEKRENRYI